MHWCKYISNIITNKETTFCTPVYNGGMRAINTAGLKKDIMCRSKQRRQVGVCEEYRSDTTRCYNDLPMYNNRPISSDGLVCGRDHAKRYGCTGYDKCGQGAGVHWCESIATKLSLPK